MKDTFIELEEPKGDKERPFYIAPSALNPLEKPRSVETVRSEEFSPQVRAIPSSGEDGLALFNVIAGAFFTQMLQIHDAQGLVLKQVMESKDTILQRLTEESERIINLQSCEIDQLTSQLDQQLSKLDTQSKLLSFLEQEERSRQQASTDRLTRKSRLKNQKKKAIRDSATLPEFLEAIKLINAKSYRYEFVRSREKISLLVLFLTGIRVANLLEVTASNLHSLLTNDTSVYFEVNAIKSRKRVVYRTLLPSDSLALARSYKNDITTLLEGKAPSDYVFTCKAGSSPLDRAALTKRLNRILRAAGKSFGKNLSSHSFRIGHVTLLIDQFGLLDAQKVIGHQNVETTLRYARNKLTSSDFTRKMQNVEPKKHNKLPRYKRVNTKTYVINEHSS